MDEGDGSLDGGWRSAAAVHLGDATFVVEDLNDAVLALEYAALAHHHSSALRDIKLVFPRGVGVKRIRIVVRGDSSVLADQPTRRSLRRIPDPAAVAEIADYSTATPMLRRSRWSPSHKGVSAGRTASSTIRLPQVARPGGRPVPLRAPGDVDLVHRDQ